MRIKGQGPKAQAQRLANGCCPKHGTNLELTASDKHGDYVRCPRRDCDFATLAGRASKLYRVLHGNLRVAK